MPFARLTWCSFLALVLIGALPASAAPREDGGETRPPASQPAGEVALPQIKGSILYLEGYPRWEYRYLVEELLRQKGVKLSVWLFSTEAGTPQAGNKPIKDVPGDAKQFAEYDVIILGDVDPRQFTDKQLVLMADFVKRGGGLIMIAGQRWSPAKYKDTPLEAVLPVTLVGVRGAAANVADKDGFRPAITAAGRASPIFRVMEDAAENEKYLTQELPSLYWYYRPLAAKADTTVLAEHPTDASADKGQRAPLLVGGKWGEGHVIFSAIDDSWRWRYKGSSAFAIYWLQQVQSVTPAQVKRD